MTQYPCVLVMPAYNESGCIEGVINRWLETASGVVDSEFRLIVVDDGSRDGTGQILDGLAAANENLMVIHQANAGHGAAVIRGYREALALGPEWVFQVDSDDQFEPSDFAALYARRKESLFILGCRQNRQDPFHRKVITAILSFLVVCLFQREILDANIPFRLIRAHYLRRILDQVPAGVFAPNAFLSVLAATDGQNLLNITVTHRERKTGKVSIIRWKLLKACFRSAWNLVRFRMGIKQSLAKIHDGSNVIQLDAFRERRNEKKDTLPDSGGGTDGAGSSVPAKRTGPS